MYLRNAVTNLIPRGAPTHKNTSCFTGISVPHRTSVAVVIETIYNFQITETEFCRFRLINFCHLHNVINLIIKPCHFTLALSYILYYDVKVYVGRFSYMTEPCIY
jgi:hypothetical protein